MANYPPPLHPQFVSKSPNVVDCLEFAAKNAEKDECEQQTACEAPF